MRRLEHVSTPPADVSKRTRRRIAVFDTSTGRFAPDNIGPARRRPGAGADEPSAFRETILVHTHHPEAAWPGWATILLVVLILAFVGGLLSYLMPQRPTRREGGAATADNPPCPDKDGAVVRRPRSIGAGAVRRDTHRSVHFERPDAFRSGPPRAVLRQVTWYRCCGVFTCEFSQATSMKATNRSAIASGAVDTGSSEDAMASEIQVYGTGWCGLTHALRKYLTESRLPYEYFDIERDPEAHEFVVAMGDGRRRFPLVVVHERVVTEPRVSELQRLLDERGIRPPPRREAKAR
jgi:glutaredoxin